MHRELIRFGGEGETLASPLILALVVLAALLIFLLPRNKVLLVVIIVGLLVPYSQQIVILGLHFMMLRLILIFGWLRVLLDPRPKAGGRRFQGVDRAVLLWCTLGTITFTVLWMDSSALINRIGILIYTTLGTYFLLRNLIQDDDDVTQAARALVWVAIVAAVGMVLEKMTAHNFISSLAGMDGFVQSRDNSLRAQGPFSHPIIAGTFGGTLLPLCLWLRAKGKTNRRWATIGVIACLSIVMSSSSSTAILALGAGVVALFAWPLRKSMRAIRWGTVLTLVGLQLLMKAPVWALIGRIDVTGGSSSYHRYMLVDQFIWRFSDWWLLGVKSTNNWGWDLWDTSNMFVEVGTTGGFATFVAFIAIAVCSFKAVGRYRRAVDGKPDQEFGIWCLGSAMFAHMAGFFGISYFDQIIVAWLVLLAMIAALSGQLFESSNEVKLKFPQMAPNGWPPAMAGSHASDFRGNQRVRRIV